MGLFLPSSEFFVKNRNYPCHEQKWNSLGEQNGPEEADTSTGHPLTRAHGQCLPFLGWRDWLMRPLLGRAR